MLEAAIGRAATTTRRVPLNCGGSTAAALHRRTRPTGWREEICNGSVPRAVI
jgi:hypothetical protein